MFRIVVQSLLVACGAVLLTVVLAAADDAQPMAPWPPTLGATHPLDASWTSEFGYAEFDGGVNAVLADGHRVILGGSFAGVGSVPSRGVIAWDETGFHPLGFGLPGTVFSLARWGGVLVAGLSQPYELEGGCINDVWTFDGTEWSPIGCFAGNVTALGEHHGQLAIASDARPLSLWNGSTWSSLPTGFLSSVSALLGIGDSLYVATSVSATSVRAWNGSSLVNVGGALSSTIASGATRRVNAMIEWNGRPVIAGNLNTENGVPRGSTVLAFDGAQWTGLGSVSGESHGLAIRNGELIASIRVGAEALVHRFTAGAWVPVDTSGANTTATALAVIGDTIVARSLTRIGGTVMSGPGAFTGGAWQPLRESWTPAMYGARVGTSTRLVPGSGEILLGGVGRFANAGVVSSVPGSIARWNGSAWTPLPAAGTLPVASSLRVGALGDLYGRTAQQVVQWDGGAWAAVTPAFPSGFLTDFGFHDGTLVGCATWDFVSTAPAGVAQIDAGDWARIGTCDFTGAFSVIQDPRVIGEWNGQLVLGGDAGLEAVCDGEFNAPTKGLAVWNGSAWTLPLAADPGAPPMDVQTLTEFEGDLVLGESLGPTPFYPFMTVSIPPQRLSGAGIASMAAGVWRTTAMAALDGHLLAGGIFVRPDSSLGYGLARWNGAQWEMLGSGMNGPITSILGAGTDVYVSGPFAWANGKPAHGIARFTGLSLLGAPGRASAAGAVALGPASPNPARGSQRLSLSLPAASHVRASVHDVSGRRIAGLLDAPRGAGRHMLVWDGRGTSGESVAPGLYFVRVRTDAGSASAALVRIK